MHAAAAEASAPTGYDGIGSRDALRRRVAREPLAAMLDAQLPHGVRLLDAGCGAGMLTNFLAMAPWRRVVGADADGGALARAEDFRSRFGIANASFVRASLARLPFRDESFDVLLSLGALAHGPDPRAGFAHVVDKLRPGGAVVLGLYPRYARAAQRGPRMSRHSQEDVLEWFDARGIEFLSGIPAPDGTALHDDARLFEPHPRAGRLRRTLSQLTCWLERPAGNGLFVMVGRRKG